MAGYCREAEAFVETPGGLVLGIDQKRVNTALLPDQGTALECIHQQPLSVTLALLRTIDAQRTERTLALRDVVWSHRVVWASQ